MLQILGLIAPLFGLIIIGFVTARITRQPLEEQGWLNTFIFYVALPALFFKLLSKTPVDQLASWEFVATNILVTYLVFTLTFVLGLWAPGAILLRPRFRDWLVRTGISATWVRQSRLLH